MSGLLTPLRYLVYCAIALPPIAVTAWVIKPERWILAVVSFAVVFTAMSVAPKIERRIRNAK